MHAHTHTPRCHSSPLEAEPLIISSVNVLHQFVHIVAVSFARHLQRFFKRLAARQQTAQTQERPTSQTATPYQREPLLAPNSVWIFTNEKMNYISKKNIMHSYMGVAVQIMIYSDLNKYDYTHMELKNWFKLDS